MGSPEQHLFERGAIYRAKEAFDALRDHFDPSERLIYFQHAVSIYDSMQGWFFHVESARRRIRTWDVGLGPYSGPIPFEKIAEVAPLVRAAESGDVSEVGRLAAARRTDHPIVRVAMDAAIDHGRASTAATLIATGKLSPQFQKRALSDAARAKALDVTRALLDAGVPASPKAIWPAVWSGSLEVVELLIERGADVAKAEQSISTMIAFCERQNHLRLAELLRGLSER